ncbi:zinc-dependent metalloprotease [Kocuria massiliensis]|uniref:zinc-dependent metalloprotease n=1 Tax=Kocuria massiliensis TaxID=1926282 RepID=UPI0022B98489|nr:zinc-dependent metalloprotease [Kocuria massiliensis]
MSPNDPYNNGNHDDDNEDNPFEELFRKLSSGQNINPEDLQGMGVPVDPAMMSGMFSQIQSMMSGMNADGSANWEQARDHARRLATADNADPSVTSTQKSAVKDAAQLAQLWLDPVIDFDRAAMADEAWSRSEWIENCFDTFREISEPVANSITEAMSTALTQQMPEEMKSMLGQGASMIGGMSGMMFAMQLGQAVGELSKEVVASTDIGLPLSPGRSALLPANIAEFGEGLDLPAQEVMLFLAVREAAHIRLFRANPWLRENILDLIQRYSHGIHVDMDRIEDATREMDPTNPESLQEALSGDIFKPTLTEDQKVTLRRLETLLALVEGWVDHVSTEATKNLPSAAALTETLRRRRAGGGPAEKTFGSLIGLELRPRRLREASQFWKGYEDGHGIEKRDALWEAPENLPTDEDLDNPQNFGTERGLLNASDEEMDAALEKLLSGGYDDPDESSGNSGSDPSEPKD